MADVEQVTFNSEGLQLHGLLWKADRPEKRVVLFCHGAFETRESWSAFADRLNQDGFSVLTFDFAGHGLSQGLRGSVNLRLWAYNIRDAINYLQARGYSVFGLVGWESGGSAALLHPVALLDAAAASRLAIGEAIRARNATGQPCASRPAEKRQYDPGR